MLIFNKYSEISLKILRKTRKVHKNKIPLRYFNYVPIGHNFFDKKKKNSFQKDV